jgi:hypothetical protein
LSRLVAMKMNGPGMESPEGGVSTHRCVRGLAARIPRAAERAYPPVVSITSLSLEVERGAASAIARSWIGRPVESKLVISPGDSRRESGEHRAELSDVFLERSRRARRRARARRCDSTAPSVVGIPRLAGARPQPRSRLLLGEASAASRGACRALPLLEPRTQRLAPISGIGSIDGLRQPDSLPSPRTKGEAL